jgi:hypothetical protein
MTKYPMAAFFVLYGITVTFDTHIPVWTVGILAWVTAAALVMEAMKTPK